MAAKVDFKALGKTVASLPRPPKGKIKVHRAKALNPAGGHWIRGLALRLCQGSDAWVIEYSFQGQPRQHKICDASVPLEMMWKQAVTKRARIDSGYDPEAERKAERTIPTLRELIHEWMEAPIVMQGQKRERRPNTVGGYKSFINNYIVPAFGHKKLTEFFDSEGNPTKHGQQLHDKIATMSAHGRGGRDKGGAFAAARVAQILKALGNYAVKKRYIKYNPFAGIVFKPSKVRENPPTEDQIHRLLKVLEEDMVLPEYSHVTNGHGRSHPEWRQLRRADAPGRGRDGWRHFRSACATYICLFESTRKMEVLASTWDQFSSDFMWWTIPTYTPIKPGGRIPVVTPVRNVLLRLRAAADVEDARRAELGLPPQPYLFPAWRSMGKTPHQTNINHYWWNVCERAGIPFNSRVNPEAVVVHDLRHTAPTLVANTTGNQFAIKGTLRHGNIRSSDHYTHVHGGMVRGSMEHTADIMLGKTTVADWRKNLQAVAKDATADELAKAQQRIAQLELELAKRTKPDGD